MKTKIILLLFLLTFCFSCNSNESSIVESNNSNLTGKWQWNKSTGGIAGLTLTPLSTNKNVVLDISLNKIKFIENGILIYDKGYNIETQQSIFGGQKQLIIYETNFSIKHSFEVSNNKLILNDECYDCYSSEYSKL